MSATFAEDLTAQIRASVHESIQDEVQKFKEKAHADLEVALTKACAQIAVELTNQVSILDRENQIVITVRKDVRG